MGGSKTSRRPAAAAALVAAAAVLGYVAGRGRQAAPLPAAAPLAAPVLPAGQGQAAYSPADLEGSPRPELVPLDEAAGAGKRAPNDFVVFKRGVVHLSGGGVTGGRPFDVLVDGKPRRLFFQPSPTDANTEELVIAVAGRDKPHEVDWGTSVSRWDGKAMTWTPKK